MAAKGKGAQHNTVSIKVKIQALKEKFTKYDRDGDNGLSICEFRDLLLESGCPMSDKAIVNFFGEFESCQGDRRITMAEIDYLENYVKRVEKLFHGLDADKSGFLDKKELRELLRMCGQDDDVTIDVLLRSVDASGDGKVTLDEFLDAVFQT